MKAQISLELELYLAIASIALLFSVIGLSRAYPNIAWQASGYGMMGLAEAINENILLGNSSMVAWLPRGACNSTVKGNELSTAHGAFALVSSVSFNGYPFCPDNRNARLLLGYGPGGGVVITR